MNTNIRKHISLSGNPKFYNAKTSGISFVYTIQISGNTPVKSFQEVCFMSNKIVVVADHDVSKELDFICSVYPNSEVLLFSSGNEIVHSHVSCFDFTDLSGVDHVRQVVSLRSSTSRDFYMVSYDMLLVFTKSVPDR